MVDDCIILYYPFFVILLHTMDCIYRVRFSIQLKRLVGCLVRFFWRRYGFRSPIFQYATNNHPSENFHMHCALDSVEMYDM